MQHVNSPKKSEPRLLGKLKELNVVQTQSGMSFFSPRGNVKSLQYHAQQCSGAIGDEGKPPLKLLSFET